MTTGKSQLNLTPSPFATHVHRRIVDDPNAAAFQMECLAIDVLGIALICDLIAFDAIDRTPSFPDKDPREALANAAKFYAAAISANAEAAATALRDNDGEQH